VKVFTRHPIEVHILSENGNVRPSQSRLTARSGSAGAWRARTDTVRDLADYFASLPPKTAHDGHWGLAERGQAIYLQGNPEANIVACLATSGSDGNRSCDSTLSLAVIIAFRRDSFEHTAAWRARMPNPKYAAYEPANPYFDLVRGALGNLVDGEHFFDIVADGVVYEVLYDVPGWPRIIQGRTDLMAQFSGYCDNIRLQSADKLITHKTDNGRVVVIEYEVHGTILVTGVKYNNRFCSIIKIENRKLAHWRDYMDSLAAWNAFTTGRAGRE
jgi:ketosteroid isomerase-like protein